VEMISRRILQSLANDGTKGSRVSIFMPAVQAGQQTQQNLIRFKNLVREAEKYLCERGMNEHDAKVFLQPAARMINDNEFWQHQDAGLAVFVAKDAFHKYRLPIEFQALAVVQERFYIKPLLPALTEGERFCILALSQNHVRLFDCGRRNVREVNLENVPRSMADALGYELTSPGMQYQSATSPSRESAGPPNHQGQVASAYEEDFKSDIQQFFRALNRGLKNYLRAGQPLVLAGVEYLLPIFRRENKHEPIVGSITGNFDVERPENLHARAWTLVEPYFAQARQDALARYGELSDTDRAVNGLEEIVIAASEGRIDTLFIARDIQRWGRFDAAAREVHVHEEPRVGDEDLLDLTTAHTLLQSGQVFLLAGEEVPDDQPQAAILRY
jgi:hypothetical protein